MKLKYYRHATSLLTVDGARVLIDPMYMKRGRLPPVPSTLNLSCNPLEEFPGSYPELGTSDLVLITHHHFDHFDSLAAELLPKANSIVTPKNGAKRLRRKGFQSILPVIPGQELQVRGLRLLATPVKHTERLGKLLYKPGVGYLLHIGGANVFVSGDTVYSGSLWTCLNERRIHLAILYGGGARIPFLGRHTLSHEEVLRFVRRFDPQYCAVLHLDSLNHCPESRDGLRRLIREAGLADNVITPLPGEEYGF